MEEESAMSSRYKVEPSLSNPCSGTSSWSESKSDEDRELLLLRTVNLRGVETHNAELKKGEAGSSLGGKRTYRHFHQMQSSQNAGGVGVPLWPLLTSGSWGCFHCCGCWQMEVETVPGPPLRCESTLHKIQLRKSRNKQNESQYSSRLRCNLPWYWPTHWGSAVLQRGTVALTHVATSWPRTWKPGSQWKCAWPPGWMSVTVTPPFSGDRGKGQESRYAVDIKT